MCSGSVSLEGFILFPQSQTLLREDVMFVDIWISGCIKNIHILHCIQVLLKLIKKSELLKRGTTDLWLHQDNHSDQVHPHIGSQSYVSQQLRGLGGNWNISYISIIRTVQSMQGILYLVTQSILHQIGPSNVKQVNVQYLDW